MKKAFVFATFIFVLSPYWLGATPVGLSINGQLLDEKGELIRYWEATDYDRHEIRVDLPVEINFYESEDSQDSIYKLNTTASAHRGLFNIHFTLPDFVLVKDHLDYTLAIDTNRNGLDPGDLFDERFQIYAVPFALSAKPVNFFVTHGGYGGEFGTHGVQFMHGRMSVAPFETPPGGVEFNQMNVYLHLVEANTTFSFGIYDYDGNLVVSSGPIVVGDVNILRSFLEIKHEKINLAPSKHYYTALTHNAPKMDAVSLRSGLLPTGPTFGIVDIPTNDGLVPPTFVADPETFELNMDTHALPITLTLVEDESATPSLGLKSKARQVRWIKTKSHEKAPDKM